MECATVSVVIKPQTVMILGEKISTWNILTQYFALWDKEPLWRFFQLLRVGLAKKLVQVFHDIIWKKLCQCFGQPSASVLIMHSDNDCQVDFWIQWPHYEMDMSQNLRKKKKKERKNSIWGLLYQ